MKKPDMDLSNTGKRGSDTWELSLYVFDEAPASIRALANVESICEECLKGRYALDVIDLAIHPEFAKRDQVVALPTLMKKFPLPARKIIGDLPNTERVLRGLGLRPTE